MIAALARILWQILLKTFSASTCVDMAVPISAARASTAPHRMSVTDPNGEQTSLPNFLGRVFALMLNYASTRLSLPALPTTAGEMLHAAATHSASVCCNIPH